MKKTSLRINGIKDLTRPVLVALTIGLLCASAFLFGMLETWSRRISDRLYLPYTADSRIVLVAIDDASMARLGRWPWDRAVHGELMNRIASAGPLAIGYDVNFPETSDAENDGALALAIQQAGKVVLPVELELSLSSGKDGYTATKFLPPISQIAVSAARIGHTNTPQDADGVVRRIPLYASLADSGVIPAFAYRILEVAGIEASLSDGADNANRVIVHYADKPGAAFPIYSAAEVMDDLEVRKLLKNRIVLVGATAPDLHDNQRVPTSITQPMNGVEIHASLLNTLLQKKFLYELPGWILALWILGIALLLGIIIPLVRARWSVPMAFLLWIGSVIAAFICFDKGWIVDILWITISIIITFSAVMLERRVASEKQKREIRHAFSHYVSSSVVDSILENPAQLQLGGVRKDMTVMFSDVRGFTTISEGLSPDALVKLMNTYLTRMTEIVFKHEGVLDKYIGDAVMAFWNAPLDQEDHAKRAVDTALEMLSELRKMNEEKLFGDLEIKIGVGINSGEMVVGNMGSTDRFDYTVIGDNVNLGSRMEGLTKQYGIALLISESTKNELPEGEYLIRPIDLVAVKGKSKPIKMYEVIKKVADATDDEKYMVEKYTEALQAYFAKDFFTAAQLTDQLTSQFPADGPSKTLKERVEYFAKEPPAEDWDGAWVMKTK
ncbi:MAG: adenylate/guanylate cyclase domain-containing protein [Patescibacteria group bacterium]|nr:adenylate/guanylate cyclase domain-containing protein [Patescibacteria group bacterium]